MIAGKNLYDRLPVWAQTLAVNFASARNFSNKHGHGFRDELARLAQHETMSRDELLRQQQLATRELLRYAVKHVPHYRNLKLSPDNLGEWPILEKRTVAANPGQFLSDEYSPHDLIRLRTSGTTGTPLTVWVTRECNQLEIAFRWRHRAWAGISHHDRGAYVSGHSVVPPDQQRPPFWRTDYVERRLLCSSYHLALSNLPFYIAALSKYAPDFIHGYPSSLYLLARYLIKNRIERLRPRAVFCASETLLDFQRDAIEQGFGAKVYNWYGNTEMACNIVECAAGGLHYRTDYGVLELLNDGTMVCTGLNNPAMPLIRYRVGDFAKTEEGTCACGCAFPLIDRIEGRIEDYLRTPDGRFVGRLDHLFKGVEHVVEAQIVQPRLDELVLRIVRAEGFGPHDEQTILAEARQRLGPSIRLRFEYPETIERTAGGKFRFIVSQLPRQQLELSPP